MSLKANLITLSNGHKIPALGLGTWQGTDDPGAVEKAVKLAIDFGYRHFDCASVYGNENEIGKAIKQKIEEGVVKREDIYIVTKLWNDEHDPKAVIPACKRSLKKLGLNYLDLYLVHWPFSYPDEVDFVETWRAMEECVKLGLTHSIGVSNFNIEQLTRLLDSASIKPVMNQIEAHINLNQKELRDFCHSKGIAVTAYSPFGAPGRDSVFQPPGPEVNLDSPVIAEIAKKYKKSNSQVALRYLIDVGTIPIPKSSSKKHLESNIDVFDFKLTEEEISAIEKLERGFRTCPATQFNNLKEYPFQEPRKKK
ncbi:aldo-keto reductase AKR2E4 [Copidosoma floridanum]|uniref:aldo-keto reductase AKR2E4 n=1 Tax=Copidosoma floridanum TaxID=29053 RepID=UPI0006C97BF7|nr:aldo-keto reductase AKR2E4 [Copidosoma floridanum]XP_014204968.1 aldo-keto reductase AKR2E4 [Copidosoma floridanum]